MSFDDVRICPCATQDEAEALLASIGVDPYGIRAMAPKMRHLNVLIKHVPCREGNIIKQEMLAVGGDAAVSRGTVGCTDPQTDVLIMGNYKQLQKFTEKMEHQPTALKGLAAVLRDIISGQDRQEEVWQTARRRITFGRRTWVMGILNCTPDSFSDGGRYLSQEEAVAFGLKMVEDGADIIDVGGESSRPGAVPVSADEELKRTIPVIKELVRNTDVPISIDTVKAKVAGEALDVGAEIVNDISAMTSDRQMESMIAHRGAGCVIMHMRGLPRTMQAGDLSYGDVVGDIISYLRARMNEAQARGIAREQCTCDPGIGFGKTVADNYTLLRRLNEFNILGRPIVIGVSRKSLIGAVTGDGSMARLEGTAAAVTAAVLGGAKVVRVHDVKEMKKVVAVAHAVRYGVAE